MKPVRNAKDHKLALAEIDDLLNAPSLDQDRIEVLITLVEAYERKIANIDTPTPGEAIRFRMEQLGLKNRDLEPILGNRSKVSEILSGKRPLSMKMVRELHRQYQIPLRALTAEPHPAASEDLPILSDKAASKLASLNVGFVKSKAQTFLKSVFGPEQSYALLRKTRTYRSNERTDHTALLYWQAAVTQLAARMETIGAFEEGSLTRVHLRELAECSAYEDGIRIAANCLSEWGIRLVYLPPLPGTFVDGAALLNKDRQPIIAISGRHDRIDNFWFTLLHEASHLTLHLQHLKPGENAFVDDIEYSGGDAIEDEADKSAQEALIPIHCFESVDWEEYSSNEDIFEVAEAAGVSLSVVAGRWQRDHNNYRTFARLIQRGVVRDELSALMTEVLAD